MQMASNSGALSSPSSSGYVGCWWGYAWLWFFASFSFLLHYAIFFYLVAIRFQNHRNTTMSTKRSPAIVDGLQELVKVILVTKLNSLSIYCHSLIFSVDFWYIYIYMGSSQFPAASTTFCIGLCRLLVGKCLIMIMNTSCLSIFLGWFLNRNSDGAPLCETQLWFIDCLSRCSALHWTKQNAGSWKVIIFWCLVFALIFLLTVLAGCLLEGHYVQKLQSQRSRKLARWVFFRHFWTVHRSKLSRQTPSRTAEISQTSSKMLGNLKQQPLSDSAAPRPYSLDTDQKWLQ
jgi:hypothetical protein